MGSSLWKAVAFGAALGFSFAVIQACGPTKPTVRCGAGTCEGCCDDATATCFRGVTTDACGSGGATCGTCQGAQVCEKLDAGSEFGGRCVTGGTGGNGGSGGAGGSTGGSGGAGTCGAGNCGSGCCTSTGSCQTTPSPARCGAGGNACVNCGAGKTCVGGACTACNGCVDVSTGTCAVGTAATACGANGALCRVCNANLGETCANGACQGGGTCNASNCTNGCCDGNNCVARSSFINSQCGSGGPNGPFQAGALCVGCVGAQSCDLDAGICIGGGNADGGFFDLDGGLPDPCALFGTPCTAGQCCDLVSCVGTASPCLLSSLLSGGSLTCTAGTCQ